MAEAGPAEALRLGRVGGDGVGEGLADLLARDLAFEADEIDDDTAAEIAQADVAGDRLGRLDVAGERGAGGGAGVGRAGVDIDHRRGAGLGDVDRAAAWPVEARRKGGGEFKVEVERGVAGDLGTVK